MGPDASECLSQEQQAFVSYVSGAYSLPALAETADHRICFRNLLPDIGCTPDPIEYVTGAIKDYGTPSPKPTTFQCYKLLDSQWFYITYWFGQLFSGFLGPAGATDAEILTIKSVLYLWILQFGPAEITYWTGIRAAVNEAQSQWVQFVARLGVNPGFSVNNGSTWADFPDSLLTWLRATCGSTAATCKDLDVFNLKTTACDSACPPDLKTLCQQIKPSSTCAVNL
jgi:hypothetical protein